MSKEERELYDSDVKAKSDCNAGIRYAEKKAEEEGKLEEKLEIACNLKSKAIAFEIIAETTGLSIDEIEKI
ncbi:putative transposase/invertase (TIGR01784 family) [Pedobacter sp. AK017]|uniref:hypothetical protein n=1 Tax=Pedobacter sp. AK017 TaxID=2723073 RepID=UPI0016208FD0|nr:hypothetical protein [Pedobacter sp. AK017]MBB5438528.1 putative transposase/invertase (TIGR01784 family) [Pedobacter sp. AK017]